MNAQAAPKFLKRIARPRSLGALVVEQIRDLIIADKLGLGEQLSEQALAEQLGVSRTPVREAFIKLAEAGLVEVLPQRGSFVRKISLKAVRDARFVREAIELAVLREAIGRRLSPAFFTTTRELLAAQRVAAASHDAERFLTLDEEFHRSFALAIDCSHAWTVIEAQKAQMDRVRFLSLPSVTPVARLIDQHEVVLDAVERGDVAASEAAMRTHLSEVLAVLEPLCQLHPDLFEQDGR
jgi:DNA-binding GntR family transcriptional regulator